MHHDNCIAFFRYDPVTKSNVHGKCNIIRRKYSMICRSWQSEDDLVIKEEQNEYSYELTGKKSFWKSSSGDPAGGYWSNPGGSIDPSRSRGSLSEALAIVMTAAVGVLFFCTSFSGGNAVIVILMATALFWLPELAGVLLAGLVLLQRKIADTFLV